MYPTRCEHGSRALRTQTCTSWAVTDATAVLVLLRCAPGQADRAALLAFREDELEENRHRKRAVSMNTVRLGIAPVRALLGDARRGPAEPAHRKP